MSFTRQSILFVSGLDKSVNENMLYQLFNEFPISYIKIAKDHQSRDPFGYAFVGFKSHSKAEEAIIKLNYSRLGKKTIRISWYNREPNNYRNNPDFNVFVKKIPKNVTHKEFHDHFSKFGNIMSARLVEDEEGEVVGYGFVLYDNPESAGQAIKEADGSEWKGKKIYVGRFEKNRPRKAPQFNNIYCKNIPKHWSKDDVEKFFSKFGDLGSVLIKEPDANSLTKLPEDKRKKILEYQYAFICYKDFGAAKKAVNTIPYYKLTDTNYNKRVERLVELISKTNSVNPDHLLKAAVYIIENTENSKTTEGDPSPEELNQMIENFNKHLKDSEDTYIPKDKSDRIECFQALKKSERMKKIKLLYEKIKKEVKEKYRFCNLYVKNLPDNITEEGLKTLFEKFGEIRSCKTVKKELFTSYLGIKRSVKVFGFVCYFDAANAREAKLKLSGYSLPGTNAKMFVDYHQSKQERADYLKLKMMSQAGKMFKGGKGMMRPFPGAEVFGPQMLRKFPPQTAFVNPNMMRPMMGQMPMQPIPSMHLPPQMGPDMMDKNTRRDYYGERLYTKISSNPAFSNYSEFFSKIVGIFLDLEDPVIERLINDDNYFNNQVMETIRLLSDKA